MTHTHTRAAITAAAAGLIVTLAACSDSTEAVSDKPVKTVTAAPDDEPAPADDAQEDAAPADDAVEDAGAAETAELPDLTGETLQDAQDAAQAAGFYGLTSSDATGADRMQILDRGWQVCSQTPEAGQHPTDTIVDFSTVKIEESCQ